MASRDEASITTADRRLVVAELAQSQVASMSLVLFVVSAVLWWSLLPELESQWRPILIFLLLSTAELIALVLNATRPMIAKAMFFAGPLLATALGLNLFGPLFAPSLAILAAIASFAVQPNLGILSAAINTLVMLLFGASVFAMLPYLLLLWAVVALEGIASRGRLTLLDWVWSSQRHAHGLVGKLRDRQAELNRTLTALNEASRRLARTNRELAIARQEAEEARALREQFVANISHEVRTPLNLIVGFAEMMYLVPETYDGVGWTPDLENDIREMYRAGRHLQALINDILDLSRIDATRLPMFREIGDLRVAVADSVATIAPLLRQRKLYCHVEQPDEMPDVFIDRTRIRQVMLNLLNNACRFTDSGGITIRLAAASESLRVSVYDTGMGVPGDQIEHIFEEFRQVEGRQRSRGGVGLGLAISRHLIRLHGGRMWAESTLNEGSCFHFTLPLPGTTAPAAELVRIPPRAQVDMADAPVFVVDPDPTIAEMLSGYLGDHPALPVSDLLEVDALVESEHPLAIIVNEPPDAPEEVWLAPAGDMSERYSVPVFRCSIPSPSWLKSSTGIDDIITKPLSRDTLRHMLHKHCPQPSKILVVDDDAGFVNLMMRMLGTMPRATKVIPAYSGEQALDLARTEHPPLVFLDLLMPEMDGFQVLAAIRGDPLLAGMTVVVVTATSYAEEALRRRGGHFTLTQSTGISTGTVVELLTAALKIVRPNYVVDERARSSA